MEVIALIFIVAVVIAILIPKPQPPEVIDPRREIRHIERNAKRAMRIRAQELHREFNESIAMHQRWKNRR